MNEENEGERRMNGRQLVNQEVLRISKEEDRADMKMMKIGNAVGSDDITNKGDALGWSNCRGINFISNIHEVVGKSWQS